MFTQYKWLHTFDIIIPARHHHRKKRLFTPWSRKVHTTNDSYWIKTAHERNRKHLIWPFLHFYFLFPSFSESMHNMSSSIRYDEWNQSNSLFNLMTCIFIHSQPKNQLPCIASQSSARLLVKLTTWPPAGLSLPISCWISNPLTTVCM